ncbi:MAG: hypothetical protein CL678_14440 [Bdellovibrionaceae bacterium]|nr:hypothetical protein [Pseudobdellovibrionaceae bacterium]|tara:strand:+ start:1395 stop:2399 length:1005 start_codon:yes stop_codon:yes gene_type:complete
MDDKEKETTESLRMRLILVCFFFICFFNMGFSSGPAKLKEKIKSLVTPKMSSKEKKQWCHSLEHSIHFYQWKWDSCKKLDWKVLGKSVQNRPLTYLTYGPENAKNTTLIFTMVHSDEITPLYIGLRLTDWLEEHASSFTNQRVILAPLVNPDGFFRKRKTRVNANKVDVNRNFPTADWNDDAIELWKKKFRSNPRRYPGKQANSEPETRFQIALIKKFKPQKILSVHAPLNFMDYDGPNILSLAKFPKEYVKKCLQLRSKVNARSGGFYPGSLGNYAGQERSIPTLTLELPSADYSKGLKYWNQFKNGIKTVIEFEVPPTLQGLPSKESKKQFF